MDDLLARDQFKDLQPGEVRSVFENAWMSGTQMRVVVMLSPAGDSVTVASNLSLLDTLYHLRKKVGSGKHVFGGERPQPGTRRHAHNGAGPSLPAVQSVLHRGGLEGSSRRSGAGVGSAGARQQREERQKYGEDRMDAAQSSHGLGLDACWTYLDPLKTVFPLLERKKHEVSAAERSPLGRRWISFAGMSGVRLALKVRLLSVRGGSLAEPMNWKGLTWPSDRIPSIRTTLSDQGAK